MKVFITRVIPEAATQLLEQAGIEYTEWQQKREIEQKELIEICQQHDAIISAGPIKIDAHFLQQCKHLKAVSLMSVGYDNVDVKAATALGIPVGNTPDVLSKTTADTAFLLMLAIARKAFYHYRRITEGNWGFYEPCGGLGIDLDNKTLGIFGLGNIGVEMAKRCIGAFNMKLIYHNRGHNEEAEQILGAKRVSFEELLQQSDVLSVHAGLSKSTENKFDKTAFAQMKPSSIFINTGRGGIHNEEDLTAALEQKLIWGAGLDVTNPEPMDRNNPLLYMPNVCVLPHIGSATEETRDKMATLAARNVIAALQGKKMEANVNDV